MDGARNSIRRPTLADLMLASDPKISLLERRWRERTQDALRTAKKFVLDAQAASYIAEMIRKYPRVIADAQDFAIPPFERMWVEFPFENFYRIITGNEPDSTGDKMVGYLFRGPTVKVGSFSYQK